MKFRVALTRWRIIVTISSSLSPALHRQAIQRPTRVPTAGPEEGQEEGAAQTFSAEGSQHKGDLRESMGFSNTISDINR